jgi:hypothetical protein
MNEPIVYKYIVPELTLMSTKAPPNFDTYFERQISKKLKFRLFIYSLSNKAMCEIKI